MTVHRPHPITDPDRAAEHGLSKPDDPDSVLYDGCERCRQHAEALVSLDESHLRRLWAKRDTYLGHLTYAEQHALNQLNLMVLVVEMATRVPVRGFASAGVTVDAQRGGPIDGDVETRPVQP
jgi:hypothetical protein